jgi:hypothetical protein
MHQWAIGTHGDMNHAPDATLAICLEDLADIVWVCQVPLEDIDLCAVLVCLRCICGQGILGDLDKPLECSRKRVVVVVDTNDLVPPCSLECVNSMGACVVLL